MRGRFLVSAAILLSRMEWKNIWRLNIPVRRWKEYPSNRTLSQLESDIRIAHRFQGMLHSITALHDFVLLGLLPPPYSVNIYSLHERISATIQAALALADDLRAIPGETVIIDHSAAQFVVGRIRFMCTHLSELALQLFVETPRVVPVPVTDHDEKQTDTSALAPRIGTDHDETQTVTSASASSKQSAPASVQSTHTSRLVAALRLPLILHLAAGFDQTSFFQAFNGMDQERSEIDTTPLQPVEIITATERANQILYQVEHSLSEIVGAEHEARPDVIPQNFK